MGDVDGASPKEQILEACRRDNTDLFHEVVELVSKGQSKEAIAQFFNSVTDTMGNYLLHVCANYGSCTSALHSTTPSHVMGLTTLTNNKTNRRRDG